MQDEASKPQTATLTIKPALHQRAFSTIRRTEVWISLILVLLAIIGGLTYFFTVKYLSAIPKKPIALVRYVQTEKKLDQIWPAVDGSDVTMDTNRQIFESLVRYQGENHLEPLLATSWTHTSDTEWTFHIKQGVKFHNGHSLTNTIVRDSLLAITNNPAFDRYTSTIVNIDAPPASDRVVIATSTADPTLPNKLAYLLIYDTNGSKQNDASNGTGPYQIKPNTAPTNSSIKLTAIDNYHGKYQWVREVDITASDTAATISYEKNHADIGRIGYNDKVDGRSYSLLQATSIINWVLLPNARHSGSPLASAAARQAVAMALDPADIIKSAGLAASVATQLLPPSIPGYLQTITPPAGNHKRITDILSSVGLTDTLKLRLAYSATQSDIAVLIKSQLNDAGFDVTLVPAEGDVALAIAQASGAADLYLVPVASQYMDGADVFKSVLHSNLFADATIDQLIAALSSTFDPSSRVNLLQQIETFAAYDEAVIPLYSPASSLFVIDPTYVARKDVPGSCLGIYFDTVYAQRSN